MCALYNSKGLEVYSLTYNLEQAPLPSQLLSSAPADNVAALYCLMATNVMISAW